jgi:hypothetical protein
MRRWPTQIGTIGDVIRQQYDVKIHCERCRHHAPADLRFIRAKHGDDFPVSGFVARSICHRCGARYSEITIRLSRPDTQETTPMEIHYRPSIAPVDAPGFASIPRLHHLSRPGIENLTERLQIGDTLIIPVRVTAPEFLAWCKELDLPPSPDRLNDYAAYKGHREEQARLESTLESLNKPQYHRNRARDFRTHAENAKLLKTQQAYRHLAELEDAMAACAEKAAAQDEGTALPEASKLAARQGRETPASGE